MRAFTRVVEAGTFTKAADSLDIPKPQITRLIQHLEQDLRTLLLNRTTRRVTVTQDGAAYYERARHVLDEIDELESSVSRAKSSPRGKLRIEVPSQIADLVLIPAMEDFHARYPDIEIDLGIGEGPLDMIGKNVDCVLRAGEITDPSVVARRIGEVRRVVFASPPYLKRFGVPQHPRDLENGCHRVITFHSRERLTYVLQRGDERYEVRAKSTFAVNDTGAMLTAGLVGLGIARTSTFQAAPHEAAGRLQVILPEWCAGVVPLYVLYPPNRHVSARLRAFIDWAAELISRTLKAHAAREAGLARGGPCGAQGR